ncbi:MAG: SpoIIIAC/SpoIIIAD family protein [Porcipelethomonas sp.]
MVSGLISVCGICICASLMCKITERYTKEQAVMLSICACVFVFILMLSDIPIIFGKIDELISASELDTDYLKIIFKSLGVCYLTQFSADICRDCGENAAASAVEIFGKIQLILLSLPLFENLIENVMVIME